MGHVTLRTSGLRMEVLLSPRKIRNRLSVGALSDTSDTRSGWGKPDRVKTGPRRRSSTSSQCCEPKTLAWKRRRGRNAWNCRIIFSMKWMILWLSRRIVIITRRLIVVVVFLNQGIIKRYVGQSLQMTFASTFSDFKGSGSHLQVQNLRLHEYRVAQKECNNFDC